MDWHRNFLEEWLYLRKNKKQTKPVDCTKYFVGNWLYLDTYTKRQHELTVDNQHQVYLDGKLLKTIIEDIDNSQVSFVDSFGYHLIIQATNFKPISIYDEANNETYDIINKEVQKENS